MQERREFPHTCLSRRQLCTRIATLNQCHIQAIEEYRTLRSRLFSIPPSIVSSHSHISSTLSRRLHRSLQGSRAQILAPHVGNHRLANGKVHPKHWLDHGKQNRDSLH